MKIRMHMCISIQSSKPCKTKSERSFFDFTGENRYSHYFVDKKEAKKSSIRKPATIHTGNWGSVYMAALMVIVKILLD